MDRALRRGANRYLGARRWMALPGNPIPSMSLFIQRTVRPLKQRILLIDDAPIVGGLNDNRLSPDIMGNEVVTAIPLPSIQQDSMSDVEMGSYSSTDSVMEVGGRGNTTEDAGGCSNGLGGGARGIPMLQSPRMNPMVDMEMVHHDGAATDDSGSDNIGTGNVSGCCSTWLKRNLFDKLLGSRETDLPQSEVGDSAAIAGGGGGVRMWLGRRYSYTCSLIAIREMNPIRYGSFPLSFASYFVNKQAPPSSDDRIYLTIAFYCGVFAMFIAPCRVPDADASLLARAKQTMASLALYGGALIGIVTAVEEHRLLFLGIAIPFLVFCHCTEDEVED